MGGLAQVDTHRVRVCGYGKLKSLIGGDIDVEVPVGSSVGELRDALIALRPESASVLGDARSRGCIGDCLVSDSRVIGVGEPVEFLPPVSGG